jgi:hypothetical protein
MRTPRPLPPKNAPDGTVWFGGPVGWFSVALSLGGEDLDPAQISQILGVEPTRGHAKGDPVAGTDRGVRRNGAWSRALKPGDTDEWDVGEVIRTLLADFPAPEEQWAQLPAGVSRRLRLGLELATANQGLSLAPDICAWLGQRGITVELDIYRADERPR